MYIGCFLVLGAILSPLVPMYYVHKRIIESQKTEYVEPKNPFENVYFVADGRLYQV